MPILRNLLGGFQKRGRKSLPMLTGRGTSADVTVDPERALQIAAVYSCVRLLSESAGMLPCALYRRTDQGRERVEDHPVRRLLTDAPNPDIDAGEFWRTIVAWMGIRGNAYAYVERNGAGIPIGLWPISPTSVEVKRADSGRLVYQAQVDGLEEWAPIREPGGLVRAENMLHYRAFGLGTEGLSPIGMARQQVGISFAAMSYIGGFFARDASPGGIVSVPGSLTDDQYERLTQQWRSLHEGFDKAHHLALLEGGAKWENTTLSPVDAAFLDTYKLTRADIAGIYGVPPHMIGDVDRSTSWGSGIEQQSLGYVIYSLMPYLSRLERATTAKLFATGDGQGVGGDEVYLKFNVNGLVRGDITARYAAYAQGRQWGWLSTNDIRRKEDEDPIGESGDVYLQPLNMVPAGSTTPPAQRARQVRALTAPTVAPSKELPVWTRRFREVFEEAFAGQADDIAAAYANEGTRSTRAVDEIVLDGVLELIARGQWDDEWLASALADLSTELSAEVGSVIAQALGGSWDARRALPYLLEQARGMATAIQATTAASVATTIAAAQAEGVEIPSAIRNMFGQMSQSRAAVLAAALVDATTNFARHEGARGAGAVTKTWITTSPDSRESHAQAHGQTVGIDEEFTIGDRTGRWPHDHTLGPDEVAGCECVLQFNL
jgi:HK97 family phage portal protein